MAEEWKPVPGYEGLYEASNLGNVRSFHAGRGSGKRGDLLRPALTGGASPRLCVVLYKNGVKKKTRLVHQLVLEAFTGPCPPGQEARHGPGGALDNRLANLCWGTKAENEADRVRDGTTNRGERQWSARLTREQVTECRRRYAAGEGQGVLAAEFGVSGPTVSNAITGATWSWLPGAVPIDRSRNGQRGTAHHAAKLTPEIVREARRRNAAGESKSALAAEYGVAQQTLQHAISGYTWKGV
jgi:NUMOD4 motif/HNH endonuclease